MPRNDRSRPAPDGIVRRFDSWWGCFQVSLYLIHALLALGLCLAMALALALRIPVWSNDKDFDAARVKRYTTAQLLRALGVR